MKKIIALAIASFLLINQTSLIRAEETASKSAREERKEELNTARDTFKQERTESRENFKEKVQETRQNFRDSISEKHADRLEKRFQAYYLRLSQLIEKLQARMNELKADGKDVTAAQTKLDEAKTSLQKAKELADQSVEGFNTINPEEYQAQRTQALKSRDLANQARQQFKLVLTQLKEVIRLLTNIK